MRHYLDLLRKLRGLGCLDARITLSLDTFPSNGMLHLKVEFAHGKEVLTKVDHVPIHEIEAVEYQHTGEQDGYLLGRIYDSLRVALNKRHAFLKGTEGPLQLHGYCRSCEKTVLFELPEKSS